jgi:hypothetical protein
MTETTAPREYQTGSGQALPRTQPGHEAVNVRGASLRAVYIIWYRDVIRYWRDRWRLGASLAQPLLFLILFGTGLSSSLRGAGGNFGGVNSSLSYQQFM